METEESFIKKYYPKILDTNNEIKPEYTFYYSKIQKKYQNYIHSLNEHQEECKLKLKYDMKNILESLNNINIDDPELFTKVFMEKKIIESNFKKCFSEFEQEEFNEILEKMNQLTNKEQVINNIKNKEIKKKLKMIIENKNDILQNIKEYSIEWNKWISADRHQELEIQNIINIDNIV